MTETQTGKRDTRRGLTKVPKILMFLLYGKVGVRREVRGNHVHCWFKNRDVYASLHLTRQELRGALKYMHACGYARVSDADEAYHTDVVIPLPTDQAYDPVGPKKGISRHA